MDKNIHGYFFNQLNKFLLRTTRSNNTIGYLPEELLHFRIFRLPRNGLVKYLTSLSTRSIRLPEIVQFNSFRRFVRGNR